MTIEHYRTLKIILCTALAVGVFVSSTAINACFCGNACAHGFQGIDLSGGPFHSRCPSAECKSCNLEFGKALKGRSAQIQSFLPDSTHSALSLLAPKGPDKSSPSMLMFPIFHMASSSFPPLYLLCHHIRC